MTRAKISRISDPALRKLYRQLHSSPAGQKAKRWKELRIGVAKILGSLTLADQTAAPSTTEN